MLLSSRLDIDDVINFKIYLRSYYKAMIERGGKGRRDIQKFEYLEKSFLDEIKNIFHNYLRAITSCKNEK